MPLYPYNTRHWLKGDIVLHMYDDKHPRMFMKVIGYTRDGLCKTRYIDRRHKRTIYKNEIRSLLDPADFKFKGHENPDEYERVRLWNFYHPIGTPILFRDGGGAFESSTRGQAYLMSGHTAVVDLVGKSGGYVLRFIQAKQSEALEVVS
jgi:hypothetical protein